MFYNIPELSPKQQRINLQKTERSIQNKLNKASVSRQTNWKLNNKLYTMKIRQLIQKSICQLTIFDNFPRKIQVSNLFTIVKYFRITVMLQHISINKHILCFTQQLIQFYLFYLTILFTYFILDLPYDSISQQSNNSFDIIKSDQISSKKTTNMNIKATSQFSVSLEQQDKLEVYSNVFYVDFKDQSWIPQITLLQSKQALASIMSIEFCGFFNVQLCKIVSKLHLPFLQILRLNACYIGDNGIRHLCKSEWQCLKHVQLLVESNKFGFDGYLFLSNSLHIKHPSQKLRLSLHNVVSELDMYNNECLQSIGNMALVSISLGKCSMLTKLMQIDLWRDMDIDVYKILRNRF